MATSLRQTMQTVGFGGKNTMSIRKDLVRKIPIYASNPLISVRKQLEFGQGSGQVHPLPPLRLSR